MLLIIFFWHRDFSNMLWSVFRVTHFMNARTCITLWLLFLPACYSCLNRDADINCTKYLIKSKKFCGNVWQKSEVNSSPRLGVALHCITSVICTFLMLPFFQILPSFSECIFVPLPLMAFLKTRRQCCKVALGVREAYIPRLERTVSWRVGKAVRPWFYFLDRTEKRWSLILRPKRLQGYPFTLKLNFEGKILW